MSGGRSAVRLEMNHQRLTFFLKGLESEDNLTGVQVSDRVLRDGQTLVKVGRRSTEYSLPYDHVF
jgi:hypothetical protein